MNYKVTCPSCGEKVLVSTHSAVKFYDVKTKTEEMSLDCPKCEEEIELIKIYLNGRM